MGLFVGKSFMPVRCEDVVIVVGGGWWGCSSASHLCSCAVRMPFCCWGWVVVVFVGKSSMLVRCEVVVIVDQVCVDQAWSIR